MDSDIVSQEYLLLFLADTVLVLHFLFVLFVVVGFLAIWMGFVLKWSWVRNRVFRISHLWAIGIVAFQSWLGIICPLTIIEMTLREKANVSIYSGSFIQHWVRNVLYYNAPEWVFMLLYTIFGSLVLASWFLVCPNKFTKG